MKTSRVWHRQLFVIVAFFACVAQAQEGPRRVVSVNLCADQLLLRLAPERVIAITTLSRRADLAPDPTLGADKPAIRGSAEEILALRPDLVVFGPFSAAATRTLLERLGLPVYTLPYVNRWMRCGMRFVPSAGWCTSRSAPQPWKHGWMRSRVPWAWRARHRSSSIISRAATAPGAAHGWVSSSSAAGASTPPSVPDSSAMAICRSSGHWPPAPTRWWRTAYQNDTPTLGERLLAHPALRRQAGEPHWLPSWAITCAGPWSFEALERLR